ncbi:putative molybdopterin oxidoreductase iron-sulfur binding subunit [Caldilinea aerophila DSM 14535 = NBRC 104270]|uniref:Putative molybdopterin oxidoreductase iron-sulfur binding subunit n=1 Tax=Caldilinea aerophila (strain DSM 14535 / JCM 11387 / NBRC 104270 / STL-6-O1) TaxID=926550 RepID=I0I750_CALAS|nr:putative molybdopterin oxidoreductase iron-sulfur binding subunit [Caldilinea aerophila DSM 14535 = NBRC 104270]
MPLGVYRTWVKYVETGAYPDVRRHFQVTRCNHCANPPCVRICPVTAMYQRADGIVEFDPRVCIGCKACMQACPYDAIYIDPESHTAAKCHYCSHRVELGLEPACVVVCPEHAIIAGDMDDPNSEISRILATQKVTVRKPEQGTAPKLFYIEGNDWSLHPTATERAPETFMWADVIPLHARPHSNGHAHGAQNGHAVGAEAAVASGALYPTTTKIAKSGVMIREPQPQGDPVGGPIHIGRGRMAEHMVQVAYNAQHKIPWHWPVPAYLVTKGIGAGVFMLLTLAFGLGLSPFDGAVASVSGFVSLLFIAATTGLLVYDLERPERFLSIVFRPQWKSWLTRGAFLLIGFSGIAGLWWLLETAALFNLLPAELSAALRLPLLWVGGMLAVGAAVYTAFLFGQAEGRDLWQSPLLPFHLVVQALMVGAGMLLVLDLFLTMPEALTQFTRMVFGVALLVDLFVTLVGEFSMPHATELAARAAHEISRGRYRRYFWQGSVLLGHVAPLAFMVLTFLFAPIAPLSAALAGLCAIAGLYFFEYAFVMAPQELPNS